jgi:hypothetical protein
LIDENAKARSLIDEHVDNCIIACRFIIVTVLNIYIDVILHLIVVNIRCQELVDIVQNDSLVNIVLEQIVVQIDTEIITAKNLALLRTQNGTNLSQNVLNLISRLDVLLVVRVTRQFAIYLFDHISLIIVLNY